MKAVKVWVCVAAIAASGMLSWHATAQETTAKPAAKKEARKPLPAYYGKLGISDEVKDELYKIDEEYDAKIEALAAQIKKLRGECDTQMQTKLTAAQKTRLKEMRDEAAAKAEAKKTKIETEKKPAAPATKSEKKPE